jgi:hypothetical protein
LQGLAVSDEQGTHARSILNIIQAWLPVLTVVIGTLWGLYEIVPVDVELAGAALLALSR